ncbi:MAG: saccharopine dehydrogenase [Calditrichaeota bacterium]|nr:saccharopine dehydrogenase [Calditrichota bacterium]
MKKVIVLGAGMVGKAIAIDLCNTFEVVSADKNEDNLSFLAQNYNMQTVHADLSEPGMVGKLVGDFDLVIGAVPGFMGFKTLKEVITAGVDVVDISFFPEDPFLLDDLAKSKNVTAVVDCGVAPGMSNFILGHHAGQMDVKSFSCYVGGLPVERRLPFQYKAPFSPIDVIEEYTRPARLKENGQVVTKPALSESEFIDFEKIGTLEAFNTDGLRTLLQTMHIPDMKEKTLRYPGHVDIMRVFRDSGFFAGEPVIADGVPVRPIDVTTKLLLPQWKLDPGEKEFTVMRIIIRGDEHGEGKIFTWNMIDYYDDESKTSSMARTTGFTCTAVAGLILEHGFQHKGICPPEFIGAEKNYFTDVLHYLRDRNIVYQMQEN